MENEIILDSCVWLSFFSPEDRNHKQAVEILEEIEEHIVVPEIVFGEVVTILRLRKKEDEVKQFYELCMGASMFLPTGRLLWRTAVRYPHAPKKLSFVDAALYILSKEYEVVTFDKVLKKAIEMRS
ncbi:PIN domain-containing protein [Candidatus Kaiserbacteria bacterium]|nr:PIN domain-containing protein [Candidatus Kaiserbacteria bacterium]